MKGFYVFQTSFIHSLFDAFSIFFWFTTIYSEEYLAVYEQCWLIIILVITHVNMPACLLLRLRFGSVCETWPCSGTEELITGQWEPGDWRTDTGTYGLTYRQTYRQTDRRKDRKTVKFKVETNTFAFFFFFCVSHTRSHLWTAGAECSVVEVLTAAR